MSFAIRVQDYPGEFNGKKMRGEKLLNLNEINLKFLGRLKRTRSEARSPYRQKRDKYYGYLPFFFDYPPPRSDLPIIYEGPSFKQ